MSLKILSYGAATDPSKCPLPKFRNPDLVRQIGVLRLDRSKLCDLSLDYEHKLSKNLLYRLRFYGKVEIEISDREEEDLLEFLEWHESLLDRASEILDSDDWTAFGIDELTILAFEIVDREGDKFYEDLFDGLNKKLSITESIQRICNNAQEIFDRT